jgi:hypothetical protein
MSIAMTGLALTSAGIQKSNVFCFLSDLTGTARAALTIKNSTHNKSNPYWISTGHQFSPLPDKLGQIHNQIGICIQNATPGSDKSKIGINLSPDTNG